jgi:hypothetical protein
MDYRTCMIGVLVALLGTALMTTTSI